MKKLFIAICCLLTTLFFGQIQRKGKIGVVFNIEGPYKIYRNAVYNMTAEDKYINDKDRFYEVIQFLGTQKAILCHA